MHYQTYAPHPDLAALVKFYWTLQVPFDPLHQRQTIIPDGCIEMTFNLADKIKRFVSEQEYLLQPDAMVMGQRTRPHDILPTGLVDTIAVCFYPYGFAAFTNNSLQQLADQEIPVNTVFGAEGDELETLVKAASGTPERIQVIEGFLLRRLCNTTTVHSIVKSTVDMLMLAKGGGSIRKLSGDDLARRRQLERKFKQIIGISPKQLSKVIRLQAALQYLLHEEEERLTDIAYEFEYFDQNHFIKDFKELVGITPKRFKNNDRLQLSKLFYQ